MIYCGKQNFTPLHNIFRFATEKFYITEFHKYYYYAQKITKKGHKNTYITP